MATPYAVPSAPQILRLRADTDSEEHDINSPGNGDTVDDKQVVTADIRESQYRLLVPVLAESTTDDAENLIQTGAAIAHDREGDLLLLCLVTVPRLTPSELVSEDEPFVQERYEMAGQLLEVAAEQGISADAVVCLGSEEEQAILNSADRYECDGVLMEVSGKQSQRRRLLAGDAVETVETRAECDVFVEKLATEAVPIDSILLTVSGGPHSNLATETARAVALRSDARIDVVHFQNTHTDNEKSDEALNATENILADVEQTTTDLVSTEKIGEEIVTRSEEYGLTVLGAPTMGLLRQFVFGPVPKTVTRHTDEAVLMVKRDTGNTSAYARWIAGDQPDSSVSAWPDYQCQSCGETFGKRRQVCPNCGGYDIRREWPEDL